MRTLTAIFTGLLCAASLAGRPGPAAAQAAPGQEQTKAEQRLGRFTYRQTKLDLDECEVIDGGGNTGWKHWRCDGLTEDWPAHVLKGEPGYLVAYGRNALKEPATVTLLGRAIALGNSVEWVLEADGDHAGPRPVAAILRMILEQNYIVSESETPQGEHPILVVTQLVPGSACPVAYVDVPGNDDAQWDARRAAARRAGSFDCRWEPEIIRP